MSFISKCFKTVLIIAALLFVTFASKYVSFFFSDLFEDVSDEFHNRVLRVPEPAPFGPEDSKLSNTNVSGSDV